MKNSERLAIIIILICIPVVPFCSTAAAGGEPNAVGLVRAVRESENWLHRIDSLKLRIEGKWTRSPEMIAAKYAELKKMSPNREPDPNSCWDLKPSYPDKLEYAIDFKTKRLRYVEEITGRQEYRGVTCHVLECTSYLDAPVTFRWYVGLEDHLLYGRKEWRNPEFVFEFWTLDYRQIAPGCRIPMTQGYNIPTYNPVTKKHYIDSVRDVKIVEARVNDKLSDELFEMKFEKGRTVVDNRSGNTVAYKYVATPPSLLGKPLPDFENIRIDFNPEQAKGMMLLICFWDMNQRPSRNCIIQLGKKAHELKEQNVLVIAIYASKIEQNKLDNWIEENDIDLSVGFITNQEKNVRFNWGVKSLPWLILTNGEHITRAEGFGLDELDAKIRETQNAIR